MANKPDAFADDSDEGIRDVQFEDTLGNRASGDSALYLRAQQLEGYKAICEDSTQWA